MNIFVGSLPFTLGEADLKQLFEAYGEVNSVKIIIDRESGRSKGFGFIEMADDEAAQQAISGLNGSEVKGRSIAVSQAEEKNQVAIAEAAVAAMVVVTVAAVVMVVAVTAVAVAAAIQEITVAAVAAKAGKKYNLN